MPASHIVQTLEPISFWYVDAGHSSQIALFVVAAPNGFTKEDLLWIVKEYALHCDSMG